MLNCKLLKPKRKGFKTYPQKYDPRVNGKIKKIINV